MQFNALNGTADSEQSVTQTAKFIPADASRVHYRLAFRPLIQFPTASSWVFWHSSLGNRSIHLSQEVPPDNNPHSCFPPRRPIYNALILRRLRGSRLCRLNAHCLSFQCENMHTHIFSKSSESRAPRGSFP